MEEMVDIGLVKNIGLSNFNRSQIQRILDNATIKPAAIQNELHVCLQQNDLVDYCKANNIVVTAHTPLGSPALCELFSKLGVTKLD